MQSILLFRGLGGGHVPPENFENKPSEIEVDSNFWLKFAKIYS